MGFFYSSLDLHLDINWQELTAVFCKVCLSIFRFYFNIKKEEEVFIYLYVWHIYFFNFDTIFWVNLALIYLVLLHNCLAIQVSINWNAKNPDCVKLDFLNDNFEDIITRRVGAVRKCVGVLWSLTLCAVILCVTDMWSFHLRAVWFNNNQHFWTLVDDFRKINKDIIRLDLVKASRIVLFNNDVLCLDGFYFC